jgi:predicted glycosyltransferase
LVVVTVGGGGDGQTLVEVYLRALASGLLDRVSSIVVTGPLMPPAARERLNRLAAALPHVRLRTLVEDFAAYLAAADVVVTMGGYNTLSEAIALGKRPVVVPRPSKSGSDEQIIRAERFDKMGIVTVVAPDDLTPDRLADAVAAELIREISPPRVLDFGGLTRIGDGILELLDRQEARR